ncbi:MAG: amidohydrolase family protein [Nocardioidaceae bacterium]
MTPTAESSQGENQTATSDRSSLADADVAGWCRDLGIPGLVDAHVHFLPSSIMSRVWEHFAAAGPLIGRPWPVTYQGTDDERVARLRDLGVRWFSALPYAHRPGVAGYLNDWAAAFASRTDGCLSSATFYPEEGAGDEVTRRIEAGAQVFKTHVQVGNFDPRDPLLEPVWSALAESGLPVVIHAGSGPVPNAHTGPGPISDVLAAHPSLCAVIAHMGAPEYDEFIALAERYERVYLDTTMVFTHFFEAMAPFPDRWLPRIVALRDKILLGSDFPNIPYPYAHQIESLDRLDLGDEWLRAVCWDNGVRLFGLPENASENVSENVSE